MSLLLDEPPLVVQPSLVRALGLPEAVVLQQLHYWLQRATAQQGGCMWVYKTYDEWAYETGLTAKAARGALDRLRKADVVITATNPNDSRDRTLWWRIDHDRLPPGRPPAPRGSLPDREGSSAGVPSLLSEANGSTETTKTETTNRENTPVNLDSHEGEVSSSKLRLVTAGEAERLTSFKNGSDGSVGLVGGDAVMNGGSGGSCVSRAVRYRSKKVPPATVESAVRLLGVFTEVTGRKASPWTRAGEPSSDLKQVIGALLSRDAGEEDWERAVRNSAVAPPSFVEGPLKQLGHVFGEKAAGWALANEGVPAAESPRDRALREKQEVADVDRAAMQRVRRKFDAAEKRKAERDVVEVGSVNGMRELRDGR